MARFFGGLRSTLFGAVACAALGACATAPRPGVPIGETVTLEAGVPVALPDRSTLAYDGLHADSRCPRTVVCIHAGSVQVRFRHAEPGGRVHALSIEAPRATSVDVGAWRLQLADLEGMTATEVRVRVDRRP